MSDAIRLASARQWTAVFHENGFPLVILIDSASSLNSSEFKIYFLGKGIVDASAELVVELQRTFVLPPCAARLAGIAT